MVLATRIFAFRGEGEEEVLATFKAFGLEAGEHDLAGGAGVSRGFQHDELARAKGFGDVIGGLLDEAHVGLHMPAKGRGNADDDRVRLFQSRHIGGGVKSAGRLHIGNHVRAQVLQIVFAFVQGVDFARVYVKAYDRMSCLVKSMQQRQADVAQADDADNGGFALRLMLKFQRHLSL